MTLRRLFVLQAVVFFIGTQQAWADTPEPDHPGWKILRTHTFLPPDFDQDTFDRLPQAWPAERATKVADLPLNERRRAIADYYGLTLNPWAPEGEFDLLGYVKTEKGWVMNCMSCHSGTFGGETRPGVGNNRYALQSLTEDVRRTKVLSLKPLSHMDLAISRLPLSTTNGTTNSVIFGVILGAKRNPDMSLNLSGKVPPLAHHDMDAPAWWHLKKKQRLYADGFSPKTHRTIMQFMLIPANDREIVLGWEEDFRQILDWLNTLEPPRYKGPIDTKLAEKGRGAFNDHCARCHGTYGDNGHYPEVVVPIKEIGTDPLRYNALSPAHRDWMRASWISNFGQDRVESNPVGYQAPPLDGIWATAPYFHNGSVPTLWHLLYPDTRPILWKQKDTSLDASLMGLSVETPDSVPEGLTPAERRWYFDTRLPGKSASGHLFVNDLRPAEKRAVLEYLKTL